MVSSLSGPGTLGASLGGIFAKMVYNYRLWEVRNVTHPAVCGTRDTRLAAAFQPPSFMHQIRHDFPFRARESAKTVVLTGS